MFGPMTTIVLGVLVAMLITGVVVIVRASREANRGKRVCQHCRNENPAAARFCAHCGQKVD
jgi:predicted amidophosphoribosyltransferase